MTGTARKHAQVGRRVVKHLTHERVHFELVHQTTSVLQIIRQISYSATAQSNIVNVFYLDCFIYIVSSNFFVLPLILW